MRSEELLIGRQVQRSCRVYLDSIASRMEDAMILVLSEADVARVLTMADGVRIVEQAFRDYANRRTMLLPRVSLNLPGSGGAFRIMSAVLPATGRFGLKTLTGYPGRRLPGETYFVVLLFDTETGALRAIIAGNQLTGLRTGAATAVAAKYLARIDAAVLGIFGAGVQAKHQIAALLEVRRLRIVKVFDIDHAKAAALAREVESRFAVDAYAAATAQDTVAGSDLVVTATTAREPVFSGDWLDEGTHVSGVGANSPVKQELDTPCFRRSKIVVDFREQVLDEAGDLRDALATEGITLDRIHADLGDVIVGAKEGRRDAREITLFKAVGVAFEDVAAAAFVYERALAAGIGASVDLTAGADALAARANLTALTGGAI